MTFASEQIATLMDNAGRPWRCPIRLEIAAGDGCSVVEIFKRDAEEPQLPLQRVFLLNHCFSIQLELEDSLAA
jgi:hypothetical protein